jgi:hypothetical protein
MKPIITTNIEKMFQLYDEQADKNEYGNLQNKTTCDKLFSVQESAVQGSLDTISGNLWNNAEQMLATGHFTTFINAFYPLCNKKSISGQNILAIKNSFGKTTGFHNVCKQAIYDTQTTKTMIIIITDTAKSTPTYYAMRIEQGKAPDSDVSVKLMMYTKNIGGSSTTTPPARPDLSPQAAGGTVSPGSFEHRPPSSHSKSSAGSTAVGGATPSASPPPQPSDHRIDTRHQNFSGGGAGPAPASANVAIDLNAYTLEFYKEWFKASQTKPFYLTKLIKLVNKFNGLTGEYLKANTQSNGSTGRYKWDLSKFTNRDYFVNLINLLYPIKDSKDPEVLQRRESLSRCVMLICGVSLQDKVVVDCHTQKFTKWTVVYGLESTFAIFKDESTSEYTIVYAGKMRPVNGVGQCEEL